MTRIAFTPPKPPKKKPRPRSGPALKTFDYYTLDFETEGIARRPDYPPRPASYSLIPPGDSKPQFWAWAHSDGNNCTKEKAKQILKNVWRSGMPVLCHHSKFDLDVAAEHMDCPVLPWDRTHDTEYLLFLQDPHAKSLSLKPSAERILKIKPSEQETLKKWILANVGAANLKPSEWGAYIYRAPAHIVGPYAAGDTVRTKRLFDKLLKEIHQRGMMGAYNRERCLMPILLENERHGIRCDLRRLERDLPMYQQALGNAERWLRKTLKAPDLNFNAKADVAEVLNSQGIVTEWTWTPGGKDKAQQRSVSKKTMTLDKFHNRRVGLVYGYRNRLQTCLSMFMESWLEWGKAAGGYLTTNWNQVRQSNERGNGLVGTRSGRPSTDEPNFLNISKDFEDKDDGFVFESWMAKFLPPLPLMREYLLPDEGEVWLHRDYNQQELRMLAHYEGAGLMQRYCEKPYRNPDGSMRFDIHSTVQKGVLDIAGLALTRGGTKILNFSDVYGKGETNLAESLGVDLGTIKKIKAAKNQLMPGVADLIKKVKQCGVDGECIRTWGGREYYVEPPAYVEKYKRWMDFNYKLVNYLIQPSAADVTKEAIIRHHEHPARRGRFLVTVYDEINISSARGYADKDMRALREAMESIETDVPMLTDGKSGKNWGSIKKYTGAAERDDDALAAGA